MYNCEDTENSDQESENSHQEIETQEISDFDSVEALVKEVSNDENSINILVPQTSDENLNTEDQSNIDSADFNFRNLYQNNPIENLKINLGSDDIPRYQCANHKLDIVIRKAIQNHSEILAIVKKLNKSNAHFKRTCKLSRAFRKKKCRLRLECKSRWSAVYLLLLSVKKAYEKNAFDNNNPDKMCPVPLETIEKYLSILKPLYVLNCSFQSSHSTIADVIPGTN
jgi:hypothetical protein